MVVAVLYWMGLLGNLVAVAVLHWMGLLCNLAAVAVLHWQQGSGEQRFLFFGVLPPILLSSPVLAVVEE